MVMHRSFMKEALQEAEKARKQNEVPVGAVIVYQGKVIGRGYNQRETLNDPIAHAEIIAIREAAKELGGWRLTNSDLYVTLEPCAMCAGAAVNARIRALYFGAYDPKAGAVSSLMKLAQDKRLNHQVEVFGGICESECGQLLKDFFKEKRKK